MLELYVENHCELLVTHIDMVLPASVGLLARVPSLTPSSHVSKKDVKSMVQSATATTLLSNPSSALLNEASKHSVFFLISRILDSALCTISEDKQISRAVVTMEMVS